MRVELSYSRNATTFSTSCGTGYDFPYAEIRGIHITYHSR